MTLNDRLRDVFKDGLRTANKGNPFWTRRDAMQALAVNHNTRTQRAPK